MQVLTPSGYVDIIDLNIGDEVIAYDINTGAQIINHLEGKTLWSPDMYPAEYTTGHYDEEGNWVPPVLVRTSYEVFQSIHGDWKYYRINGTWDLFKLQSVWANMNVVHASDLQIGDIVYNDQDGDVVITSIEEVDVPLTWWKLDVSGDSSYIADDITLHNASRYWVGGGSSSNWNATGNTNWSSTSGGANNASVPTSADVANFDGAGNSSSVISATITIGGLIITSAYTATMTHNAIVIIAGSVTLGANYTIAGTSAIQISAVSTITSNGKTWSNDFILAVASTVITLVGDLTINGTFYIGAYNGATVTLNKTTTEKVIANGPLAATQGNGPNYIIGTASLDFYGSAWSGVRVGIPLTIYGTVSLSGTNVGVYGGFTNLGTINAGTSTFHGNGPSFNSNGAVFNNFQTGYGTLTLTSNLTINGTFLNDGAQSINKTTNEVVYAYGGLSQYTSNQTFGGTATIILKGGTWTAGSTSNAPFTMPITIDGNITIGGALIYGGTFTYSSGTLTQSSGSFTLGNYAQTLNLNGLSINFPIILGGNTKTLSSNFSTNGLVTVSSNTTVNRATTETFTCGGGITVNAVLAGTAGIYLTGGTWSGTNTTGIGNNLFINGNITISGSVYYGTGTLTYVSGTPIVTGSSLGLPTSCTMNTSGMTWNNIFHSQINVTLTLTSNLNLNGQLTIAGGQAFNINKTTSEVVNTYGGVLANYGNLSGTAPVYVKGGSITNTGGQFGGTLYLDGDITITGNFYIQQATLNYSSGSINTSGCTLQIGNHAINTLNTAGMIWETVTTPGNAAATTFLSDFVARNITLSATSHTFNTSTGARFIPLNSLTLGNTFPWAGNVTLVLGSNVVANFANSNISTLPITIDGDCTIMNTLNTGANVMTYVKGKVNFINFIHNVTDNATFRGFGRLPVPRVNITAAKTISMDQFFTGTPQTPANITCSTAAGTYTVAFTDTFERVATNVVTSGCVLSRPMQLIVSSPFRINSIRTTNSGIRYVNQSPNGFAKNTPAVAGLSTGVPGGLLSDPCFTKQS